MTEATKTNDQIFNTTVCCSVFSAIKGDSIQTFPPDPMYSIGVKQSLETTPIVIRGTACLSPRSELVLGRGFDKLPNGVLASADRLIFLVGEHVAPHVDALETIVKSALRPHNTRQSDRLANKAITIVFVVPHRTHFSLVRSIDVTI